MATRTAPSVGGMPVLRRQPNDIVRGKPHGGYTNAFEVICPSCGDLAEVDYRDAPPRIQRLRGPYRLSQGINAYEAHFTWHQGRSGAR